jgi:hypothetical protein
VLPFTKRPARSEEGSDLLKTGDIEVVPTGDRPARANANSSFPPPPAGRPRVFTRSSPDDEMTTLLPRKGMTFSARPPAAIAPVPMPKLAPARSPRPMLEEPPTRQFVMRPGAPPPSLSPVVEPAAPPAAPAATGPASPVAGPLRQSNRPPALEMKPVGAVKANAKATPGKGSDPRIDPPATVVTARTRIVAARPTMSWAAALVAMGVFVGLVTAVVARGDADTLIDATASFVDPSGGAHAAGAGMEAVSVQTKAEERRTTLLPTIDTLVVPEPPADARTAAADTSAATPLPPRPAPVAFAAPVRRPVWHPSRPAPSQERIAASAKPAPAPKAASAKPGRASDDDVESASAADALAKAQLEASLR